MKWITRENVKVDRVACPWLIKKFVDRDAEFSFVASDKVQTEAARLNAIPFDVPNVELGHQGDLCSFDAIIHKYQLDRKDPTLLELAKIVRGADTPNRTLTAQSEGLLAIATGFSINSKDDYDNMSKQFNVYDALYSFCKLKTK